MELFRHLLDILKASFGMRQIKELKSQLSKIIGLNHELLNQCNEIDRLCNENNTLIDKATELLDNHNFHQQNLHAQKIGLKSGVQYKAKLASEKNENLAKITDAHKQREHFETEVELNKKKLSAIRNSIFFLIAFRSMVILSFFASVLIAFNLISYATGFTALANNRLFFALSNGSVFLICISMLCLSEIAKRKELIEKSNFLIPLIPFFINLIIGTLMVSQGIFAGILISLLTSIIAICHVIALIGLANNPEQKQKFFPDEFILSILNIFVFAVLIIMSNNSLDLPFTIFNSVLLSTIVGMLLISYTWSFIKLKHKVDVKSFARFASLILSLALITVLLILTIFSFTFSLSGILEILSIIAAILTVFGAVIMAVYQNQKNQND